MLNKLGHTKTACYWKHGFPVVHDKNTKQNYVKRKPCTQYGRNGHTVDVCYRNMNFLPDISNSNLHVPVLS